MSGEWVKLAERLPEIGQDVIGYFARRDGGPDGALSTAAYLEDGLHVQAHDLANDDYKLVLWMVAPSKPTRRADGWHKVAKLVPPVRVPVIAWVIASHEGLESASPTVYRAEPFPRWEGVPLNYKVSHWQELPPLPVLEKVAA